MTTKKTPREIAEKAVAFANRTDVVRDGYEMPIVLPNVVTYIHNNPKIDHGTYRSYIAAFGYATGYQDAQNEQQTGTIDLPTTDDIFKVMRDVDSDYDKAEAVLELLRSTLKSAHIARRGLPEPITELVNYWRDSSVSDSLRDGFRDGLRVCAMDLEKAIGQTNIGIVVKPPPPPPPPAAPIPMPSDEEIARFVHCEVYGKSQDHDHIANTTALLGNSRTYLVNTLKDENGSKVEACAIKLAFMYFAFRQPLPPKPVVAPNELSTEIDDELAKAAAEYANTQFDCQAWSWDVPEAKKIAKSTMQILKERARKVVIGEWGFVVHGFVAGAHWQLAMVERARAGEETTAREYEQRIDDLQKEIARLQEITSKDADLHVMLRNYALPTEAKAFAQEYESRRDGWLFVPKDQKQAFAPAPEPVIVFDNDEEREYWSAVSLDRNHWNGDEGPEAIGAYADRMVQVRRARMPTKVELPLEGYRLLFAVGAELAMLGAPAFQIQPRTANFVITFFFHYEIHEFGTKDFRGNTPGEIAADLISRVK